MYYVWFDENNKITETLRQGYHQNIPEEKLSQAILMEELPSPEEIEGKYAEIFINPETKEYVYEYHGIPPAPPTTEERLAILEEALDTLILDSLS